MHPVLQRYIEIANLLTAHNLHLLDELYDPAILFEDPVERVEGLEAVKAYYAHLYEGVATIRFDFEGIVEADPALSQPAPPAPDGPAPPERAASLFWVMHMRHKTFRHGEELHLPGATWLRYTSKIHFHRDYFDLGAMLYERIPLMGRAIRSIKSRLKSAQNT